MQRCKTCGSVLPAHARFCGHCGQIDIPGSPLLSTLASQGQARVANVPKVQGTPQGAECRW